MTDRKEILEQLQRLKAKADESAHGKSAAAYPVRTGTQGGLGSQKLGPDNKGERNLSPLGYVSAHHRQRL